ncbi:hypothetical protein [Breoghania sp.]|uniref:hypothetical protein n=1 Tax=Breoghania sp. TaxID=2065378 RepID=UPI00262618C8|nr:hypothetical protein [Breoghania sp.]MDJ0933565.1 hypothetical protein [Breoghania sp.]
MGEEEFPAFDRQGAFHLDLDLQNVAIEDQKRHDHQPDGDLDPPHRLFVCRKQIE